MMTINRYGYHRTSKANEAGRAIEKGRMEVKMQVVERLLARKEIKEELGIQ